MSRGLSSNQIAASAASHRKVVPMVEVVLDSGTLRYCLAPFDVTYGANTFLAVGGLVTIRQIRESANSVEGMEISMSGLDSAIIALAIAEPYRGRIGTIYKAYLNSDTNQLIDAPVAMWIGRIKTMGITEKNDSCAVSLMLEHYEAELKRPAPMRYNSQDQWRLFPNDLGFEYVEDTTERQIIWPTIEALKH